MKKFTQILSIITLSLCIWTSVPAYQTDAQSIPGVDDLFDRSNENDRKSEFFEDTPLIDYTGTTRTLPDGRIAEAGQYQFRFLVERVINIIKQAMIPISIALLVVGGLTLIFAGSDEEALAKRKSQLIGTAMGFGLFVMAVTLVDSIFFGQQGEIFRFGTTNEQYQQIDACRAQGISLADCPAYVDYTAEFGNRFGAEILALFNFLSSFMVGVAVLFLVIGGFQIMTAGGEEAQTQAKNRVLYSAAGIFMVVIFQQLYRVLVKNGQVRVPYGNDILELAGGWLNFIIGTVGFISVVALVYGGIRLLTSFGNEEAMSTAKTVIMGAIIGIVITLSAYTIVGFIATPF